MNGFLYWMDRAIENFEQVWSILIKVENGAEKEIDRLALNKHVELLKNNYPDFLYGKKVETIESIKRRYMKGINLIRACCIAKILDTIKEGELIIYCGLEIKLECGIIKTNNIKGKRLLKLKKE